jgi:hypothetical protein
MRGLTGSQLRVSTADGAALGGQIKLSWRVALAATLTVALSLALGAAPHDAGNPTSATPHPLARSGLWRLPLTAQGPISGALGADEPAYRLGVAAGGYRAVSTPQDLSASFTAAGAGISSGATHVRLGLSAVGYGSSLTSLPAVTPTAHANRVVYDHGGVSEWYANGPIGIEQGFTLPRAPAGHAAGPLTLSLALAGDARPTAASGGQSVSLGHPGSATLHYGGLTVSDARGRLLHSWLSLQPGRLLLRVDTRGARYPIRIDPFIHQGPKLIGSGEIGDGLFGISVALSADGNTALIGASDGLEDPRLGEAFVFIRSGGVWKQQQRLTGNGTPDEQFGLELALSADGNTALIGTETTGVAPALVFTRTGGVWTKQGELKGDSTQDQGDLARVALSADGNTALVGEPLDGGVGSVGSVFVFTRSGAVWTEKQKLTGSIPAEFGGFGSRVALSADGKTALISEPLEGAEITEEGMVFVYARAGGVWSKQQTLTAGGVVFGDSIALSADGGTALAVGEPALNTNKGITHVYVRSGGVWTLQQDLTPPGEEGGAPVALSADGNLALVGAESNPPEGSAFVFARSGGSWTQEQELTSGGSGSAGFGAFGSGVALSSDGGTAVVSAFEDQSIGAAWPFVASKNASLAFFPSIEIPKAGPRFVAPNEPVELSGAWQVALTQGTISCPNATLEGTLLRNGAKRDSLSVAQASFGGTAGCTSTSPLGDNVTLNAGLGRGEPPYRGYIAIGGKGQLAGNPEVVLTATFTAVNGAQASCTWQTRKLTGTFRPVEQVPILIQTTDQAVRLVRSTSDPACPVSARLAATQALYVRDTAGDRRAVFLSG